MGEARNVVALTDDVQTNINRSATEFRAPWMALVYDELRGDGADLEPVIRGAIWKCGEIYDENYEAACVNPDNCEDSANVFLNELRRKTSKKRIIEMREPEVLVDFHYCSLPTAWKKLGFGDETCTLLCDIVMDGDRGIAGGMGLQLDLTETLAERCPVCKLRFYK